MLKTGCSTFRNLREKELATNGVKYYPGKQILLIPDFVLPHGISFLKRLYVLGRQLDDICDWDDDSDVGVQVLRDIMVFKEEVASLTSWDSLIWLADNGNSFVLEFKNILFGIYQKFWFDTLKMVLDSMNKCMECLNYDKGRIESHQRWITIYPSDSDIWKYIDDLELYGVLRPLLSLLWNDGVDIDEFKTLIRATRWDYYFSRDLREDSENGLYNWDFNNMSCPNLAKQTMIDRWRKSLKEFQLHSQDVLHQLNFFGKLAIERLYVSPADRYFSSN